MSKENPVITIGGPPGAGTTTIAKGAAAELGLRYFSTGKIFRRIAEERGLDVENLSEQAETEVDLEVDRQSREEAARRGVVIESKLAAWINEGVADYSFWLTAPLDVRAGRIFNDEKKRTAEEYSSLEEAKERVDKRFNEDKQRYAECYEIDLDDMDVYDLVIDTSILGPEEVINKIVTYVKGEVVEKCLKSVELASKQPDAKPAGTA